MVAKKYHFYVNERKYDHADVNCEFWRGGSYVAHTHEDYYEILLPISNSFVNIVDDEVKLLSPRDIVIIPPGPTHAIQTVGNRNAPHFNLAIEKKYFESQLKARKIFRTFIEQKKPYYLTVGEHASAVIISLLNTINNDNYDKLFSLTIDTILSLITCYCERKEIFENQSEEVVVSFCQDAIDKIKNGYFLSGNVTDIYRAYPVSHTTFGEEFKKITNCTLIDYLSKQRVSYAKKLLITTDLSVLEISGIIGYESVSHFIRKFKSEYGKSPLQYRKEHQKGTEFQGKIHLEKNENNKV